MDVMTELILRMNEGNDVVDRNLSRLQTTGRKSVKVSTGIDAIGDLKDGDTLFILGHGNPTKLGNKSAEEMAKLLSDAGLKSRIAIELVACNSGTGSVPFALELKTRLVSKKIVPSSVSGGTNYMVVGSDGAHKAVAVDFAAKTAVEMDDSTEIVQTPWGPRRRNKPKSYAAT
jgi:hypothetical protein